MIDSLLARVGLLGLVVLLAAAGGAVASGAPRVVGSGEAARVAARAPVLAVLPEDGREIYLRAFDRARRHVRIEICVLEDPGILAALRAALERGVRVRVIVDRGKYDALEAERTHLEQYLTAFGGELHLSNPVFPRSFPKVILVDSDVVIYGSACLDQTTFTQYRDFAHASSRRALVRQLGRLFENDWAHSAAPGQEPPPFNPTTRIPVRGTLLVSPVNSAAGLVSLYQRSRRTLDVYTELLGNRTLESELAAAVARGVRVRLIAPRTVNGGTPEIDERQLASLAALAAAGVLVHVSGPEETAELPYMHARAAVVDGTLAYLGSISLSPDSTTVNREVSVMLRERAVVERLRQQFEEDFLRRTRPY